MSRSSLTMFCITLLALVGPGGLQAQASSQEDVIPTSEGDLQAHSPTRSLPPHSERGFQYPRSSGQGASHPAPGCTGMGISGP